MRLRDPEIAYLLAAILVLSHLPLSMASAQGISLEVASRIATVSRDSLLVYVSELSGELPVYVTDSTLIAMPADSGRVDSLWVAETYIEMPNRVEWANDAATQYLVDRLRSFGYDSILVDAYPDHVKYPTTKNVIAVKPSAVANSPVWVIGAHYDSVVQAPGADDNATGTAVVLECARVLAEIDMNAEVMFGFWDTEEAGLIGSELFAAKADSLNRRIDGVLNFDMVGWDRDGDHSVELHAHESARWIADYMGQVILDYTLDLSPNFVTPGLGRSDHVSFRSHGFPAVLIIEELGAGFNPYYHSPDDVLGHLSPDFLFEVTKMAVGTMTLLGSTGTSVSSEPGSTMRRELDFVSVYPNPASRFVYFEFDGDESPTTLFVTDVLGRRVAELDGDGGTTLRWTIPPGAANGVYLAASMSDGSRLTRSFVVRR